MILLITISLLTYSFDCSAQSGPDMTGKWSVKSNCLAPSYHADSEKGFLFVPVKNEPASVKKTMVDKIWFIDSDLAKVYYSDGSVFSCTWTYNVIHPDHNKNIRHITFTGSSHDPFYIGFYYDPSLNPNKDSYEIGYTGTSDLYMRYCMIGTMQRTQE